MGNGSIKYLSQLKNYSRRVNRNGTNWNAKVVIYINMHHQCIFTKWIKTILHLKWCKCLQSRDFNFDIISLFAFILLLLSPCLRNKSFLFVFQVLKERTNYLILVLCEDVTIEDLDKEMRIYLRTNTYLRRDSRWFWEKLRYAMPQKTLLELREGLNVRQDDDWCGVHAIARAQLAELVGPTADQGKGGHPRQERRIRDEQVM